MRNFLGIIFSILISVTAAYATDMRIVQVDGVRYNPDEQQSVIDFENLVKDINKQKHVDFVVFTGNNISKPDKHYLTKFTGKANRLNSPYYVVLGNKDVNKQKHFGKVDYVKTLRWHAKSHKRIKSPNYVLNKGEIVYIFVDGSKEVITMPNGYYRPEVLEWLDKQLTKYSKKNVIIFQHFPIIPPVQKETYYTFKPEEYLAVLAKHNNVKAVIAGHFGVNNEQTYNGVLHVSTTNAPHYRIIDIIECETNDPTIWSTLK